MSLLEAITRNLKSDLKEADNTQLDRDFQDFIKEKYGITSVEDLADQLEHLTEDDVNEFFTDRFYDINSEEELNNLNKDEDYIRINYQVGPVEEEDFEPTPEDLEDMRYWYNDDPREDWEAGRTNDYYNKPFNESFNHELREPHDRSKEKIDRILALTDELYSKSGKEINFNNKIPNKYTLTLDGETYTFYVYQDIINALELLNKFI